MELQPSTAPLPPLLAEVRRRHPAVDIVVLPSDEPLPAGGRSHEVDGVDEAQDAEVAATRRRVDEVAGQVGELVGCSLPESVLRHGRVPGGIRARTRCSLVRDDGAEALRRLGDGLLAQGWQVRRPAGAVDRLVAHREGLELRGSWARSSGAFLLDVSSGSLVVGESRARTLVRS